MKLLKYLFFILILIGSLIFLVKLNELNSLNIRIPYLVDVEGYEEGFNVWLVMILTFTAGVLLGFILSLFQIITQKTETLSLKSNLRRMQVELDSLRNQAIDDDIVLTDDIESENYE
jgi:uncharacterized membrane protein YciS (DUF1049 family)